HTPAAASRARRQAGSRGDGGDADRAYAAGEPMVRTAAIGPRPYGADEATPPMVCWATEFVGAAGFPLATNFPAAILPR
ncbi:hypothetical protein, partial [Gordonia aichiensis]